MRAKLFYLTTRLSGMTGFVATMIYSQAVAASDLKTLASGWTATAGALATTIGSGVFLLGIITALAAALKFKAHGEDPRNTPLKICLIYAAAAAAMIGLPTMLGVGVGTLFGSGNSTMVDSGGNGLDKIKGP